MKGICLRYSGDPEMAKDLVQEGFIKVFSNIRQHKVDGSFEGWMKRIFINISISHLRKQQKRHVHIKLEDMNDSMLVESENYDFDKKLEFDQGDFMLNHNNYEIVSTADFSESELLKVLEKIPENFRIVFNLYCIENLKHEEIAELLDIDVGTSRSRLLRARQLIQKKLFEMSIARLSI
jgi:RNA polymerase sigma-70 factor, ECF subfamily